MMKIREIATRYCMLVIGLFFMTIGIALSIKANLGTTPISCIPYVLSLNFPLSVGDFTIIFNVLLVILQIIILRKDFEIKQLFQIVICFIFGFFTDFALYLLSGLIIINYLMAWIISILGCFVLAFGILIEVKAQVIYMAGEGVVLAISKVTGIEFGKVKPFFDCSMVIIGILCSFIFTGSLEGIGEGTVLAAIIIGFIVKFYKDLFGSKIDQFRDKIIGN